jgi:hypothetical protein
MVVLVLKYGIPPDTPDDIPVPPFGTGKIPVT